MLQVGLGGERRLRALDRFEPDLADSVPRGLGRRPGLDDAESEPADAGKLLDDLGMRAGPVGDELLTREARFAADKAHALDHRRTASICPVVALR